MSFGQILGVASLWVILWGALCALQYLELAYWEAMKASNTQLWLLQARWYWCLLTGVYSNGNQVVMPVAAAQIMTLPTMLVDICVHLAVGEQMAGELRILVSFLWMVLSYITANIVKKRYRQPD